MKKIIAVAVASALFSPLALAEVKLSGSVGVEFEGTITTNEDKRTDSSAGMDSGMTSEMTSSSETTREFRLKAAGTSITLSGSNQISGDFKASWRISQNINWSRFGTDEDGKAENGEGKSSIALGNVYLDLNSPQFGSLKFGKFGRPLDGGGTALVQVTTPNILNLAGLSGQDFKISLVFEPFAGAKPTKGFAGNGYFATAKYNFKSEDIGTFDLSYAFSRFDEKDILDRTILVRKETTQMEGMQSQEASFSDMQFEELMRSNKSYASWAGPQSHKVSLSYTTPKLFGNDTFKVGGSFRYDRGKWDNTARDYKGRSLGYTIAENRIVADDKYSYDQENTIEAFVEYKAEDLGLTPKLTFATNLSGIKDGKVLATGKTSGDDIYKNKSKYFKVSFDTSYDINDFSLSAGVGYKRISYKSSGDMNADVSVMGATGSGNMMNSEGSARDLADSEISFNFGIKTKF